MKTLYKKLTAFHNLSVIEEKGIRYLLSGNGMAREQGAMVVKTPLFNVFDFSLLSMYSLSFFANLSDIKNVLIVGLGAGVIPHQMFSYLPDVNIDVIEIDKEIVDIAKKYFCFPESERIKIYVGDAFLEAPKLTKKYDIIILDAYLTNYIPYHLMTKNFMITLSKLLESYGVLTINTCNQHPSFHSQINTIVDTFGDGIYKCNGNRNELATMLYVCGHKPIKTHDFNGCSIEIPQRMQITEEIKKAMIFNIKSV